MIYNISQGRVEPAVRRGGQLCYSSVENLLQYMCAKNYQNIMQTMQLDIVIAKNIRVQFFGPTVYMYAVFLRYRQRNILVPKMTFRLQRSLKVIMYVIP